MHPNIAAAEILTNLERIGLTANITQENLSGLNLVSSNILLGSGPISSGFCCGTSGKEKAISLIEAFERFLFFSLNNSDFRLNIIVKRPEYLNYIEPLLSSYEGTLTELANSSTKSITTNGWAIEQNEASALLKSMEELTERALIKNIYTESFEVSKLKLITTDLELLKIPYFLKDNLDVYWCSSEYGILTIATLLQKDKLAIGSAFSSIPTLDLLSHSIFEAIAEWHFSSTTINPVDKSLCDYLYSNTRNLQTSVDKALSKVKTFNKRLPFKTSKTVSISKIQNLFLAFPIY